MADLVFIGGVGKSEEYGGELSKNKLIISRLRKTGLKVSVVDTYNARKNPFKLWSLPLKVMSHPNAPVVFSTNFGNIRPISALIKKTYPNRKQILWVIGGVLPDKIIDGVFRVSDFYVFDAIFVESRSMQRKMTDLGLTKTYYLPNFKDGSLSVGRCGFSGLEEQLRCVFFSRVEPSKGVDIILDALESDTLRDKNITVDFYGEIKEWYRKEFNGRISRLDNVRYCGKLNFFDGSGQRTLGDYHLALFPTYWKGEGFPGVIVDALFAGLPILASDWNCNPEIVTPQLGFICCAKDVDDFTAKLSTVYDNRMELPEYSLRCKDAAKGFDVDSLITRDFVSRYLINLDADD